MYDDYDDVDPSDPNSAYSSLLSEHDFAYDDDYNNNNNHHHRQQQRTSEDPVLAAPPPRPRQQPPQQHRRAKSSPTPSGWAAGYEFSASRPWLSTAESRTSWTGERPPTRKLVKDPNGSGRPSMSIELSDSDGEKEKGIMKRGFEKLRDLYRRDK